MLQTGSLSVKHSSKLFRLFMEFKSSTIVGGVTKFKHKYVHYLSYSLPTSDLSGSVVNIACFSH